MSFICAGLAVKGHGIPASAVSGALSAAQIFFALPESSKMKVWNGPCFMEVRLPLLKRRRDDPLARYPQESELQRVHVAARRKHESGESRGPPRRF